MQKKKLIIAILIALVAIAIAIYFFVLPKLQNRGWFSSINVIKNLPSANPFENAKINPFKDVYKNPFK